jgi:hypothetical protein
VNKQHNDNLLTGSCTRTRIGLKMLQSSSKCSKLFVVPGNAKHQNCQKTFFLNILDLDAIKTFALAEKWIWLLLT